MNESNAHPENKQTHSKVSQSYLIAGKTQLRSNSGMETKSGLRPTFTRVTLLCNAAFGLSAATAGNATAAGTLAGDKQRHTTSVGAYEFGAQ